MRISPAKLLIVLAILIVILVELRTVFAVLGLDVSPLAIAVLGVLVIAAVLIWAVSPQPDGPG